MKEYQVTISNTFEAETPEDAVQQMVEYLSANCGQAGYRWQEVPAALDGPTGFIDAEDLAGAFFNPHPEFPIEPLCCSFHYPVEVKD